MTDPLTDTATSIVANITSWTFKTVLILFFLVLMATSYYLYQDNTKLHEQVTTAQAELSGCKMEVLYLRKK